MPFQKGQSGNPGGRRKGIPNKATAEIRTLAQSLFDKAYWERVKTQLAADTLHPSIHAKLLAYAYGEPKQEHSGGGVQVHLGFITSTQSRPVIDDQSTIEGTAQVMTLPERRRLR